MKDRKPSGLITLPGLTSRPTPAHRRRLLFFVVFILIAFSGLTVRLFDLQVLRNSRVEEITSRTFTSYAPLRGVRGDILTGDDTLLAREVLEYSVAIDPGLIAPQNLPATIDLLCRALGLSDEERRKNHARIEDRREAAAGGAGKDLRFLELKRGVKAGLVDELRGAVGRILSPKEERGVIFNPVHFRQYPRGAFLGAVVGATRQGRSGDDLEGAAGLELALDASLSGRDGQRKLRCEGRRVDRWFWPAEVDIHSVNGYNATLTIDSQVQGIAEEELERGLEREKAAAGIAIVMDCRSGDVLAMVNLPGLDPNHYHDYPGQEFTERRRNRAVESQFEPGSTIKPFIVAMALEKRLYAPEDRIWEGGRLKFFGRRRVEDVSDHGPLTVAEAVIFSSNIAMAHVGLRLGREGLNEALDRFRFQTPTGVGLPGEARGQRSKRREWSENYTSVSVSFGYAFTVTPIQLAAAYSSLVNGGRFVKPRIVDRLERDGEIIRFPRDTEGRSIQESTSRKMREILVEVVERGTARGLKIPGLAFGGKTGTAMTAGKGGYAARDYLSSFVGFAPAEDPRVVVLVMIEKPQVRHYGGTVAGPVVQEILRRMFRPVPSPLVPPEGTVAVRPAASVVVSREGAVADSLGRTVVAPRKGAVAVRPAGSVAVSREGAVAVRPAGSVAVSREGAVAVRPAGSMAVAR
jgi:cell division protein FtsI/penicillin-binding protein 2